MSSEYRMIVVAGMRKLAWGLTTDATSDQLERIVIGAGFSTYSQTPRSDVDNQIPLTTQNFASADTQWNISTVKIVI